MTNRTALWTRELLERRRALHAQIDGIARSHPAAAARLRLALYTATHRFDREHADAGALAGELGSLELELTALSRAA